MKDTIQNLKIRLKNTLDFNAVPDEIKDLISLDDYHTLLHFAIRLDTTLFNELNPGECLYFQRKIHSTPRSFSIGLSPEGEYEFIIETKGKLADGSKISAEEKKRQTRQGTSKISRSSWRVDVYPIVEMESQRNKQPTKINSQEAKFPNQLRSRTIIKVMLSREYQSSSFTKNRLYSEHMKITLTDFLNRKINMNSDNVYLLMAELIQAITLCHESQIVFSDLKADNVLLYKDVDNVYRIKLIDFGSIQENNTFLNHPPSSGYEPPELLRFLKDKKDLPIWKLYNQYSSYAKNRFSLFDDNSPFLFVNNKFDVWALGILFLELFYRINHQDTLYPHIISELNLEFINSQINQYDFLKEMLSNDPTQRSSIDTVNINFHETFPNIQPILMKKENIPVTVNIPDIFKKIANHSFWNSLQKSPSLWKSTPNIIDQLRSVNSIESLTLLKNSLQKVSESGSHETALNQFIEIIKNADFEKQPIALLYELATFCDEFGFNIYFEEIHRRECILN